MPETTTRRVAREVRRPAARVPWLELVDGWRAGVRAPVRGETRTVWCTLGPEVALLAAGFEAWWADAEPLG